MISIGIDLVGPHRLFLGGVPVWTKYSLDYTDFATAAASNEITLGVVPAKTVIHATVLKHGASFTGGTIASYTLKVGISGAPGKYLSPFDVFQAPGDTVGSVANDGFCEDYANPVTVTITATATGDTLDNATAGTVDVWLYTSQLP